MKLYLLIFFIIISTSILFGQKNDTWISFWNKDSTSFGYKDQNGVVKIQSKFTGLSNAGKFDNIVAVMEKNNNKLESYYLTKAGKIVGRDSLHIFDNGFDCESEGFIRFRDKKTDKVGLFDRMGKVVVPAIYNDLTQVKNGMLAGLRDAKKEYWSKDKDDYCNHYSWTGGNEVLIDTSNKILIDNFSYDNTNALDFYTLQKTDQPSKDTIRKSFLGKDGTYYSFIDFEKEFRQWIKRELTNNLTKEKLMNISYDTIVWESKDGWAKTNKEKLINDNFDILKNELLEIFQPQTQYFVSSDGLNPFIYDGASFDKYFNNCGEPKDWIYPTMSIIISHEVGKDFSQNHYEFLRTDDGYKLISLTIRNQELKQE